MIKERYTHLDARAFQRANRTRRAPAWKVALAAVTFAVAASALSPAYAQKTGSRKSGLSNQRSAQTSARESRATQSNNPAAAFYHAVTLYNAERYADALRAFKALSANPQFLDLSYGYAARCLMKMERLDEAQALIEQYNQRNPGNAMTSAIYDEIVETRRLRDNNAPALAINRLADANPIAAAAESDSGTVPSFYADRQYSAPVPPPTQLLARANPEPRDTGVPPPTGFTADGRYVGSSRDGAGLPARPRDARSIKPGAESLADQFSQDRKLKGYDDLPQENQSRKIDEAYAQLGAKGALNTEGVPSLGGNRPSPSPETGQATSRGGESDSSSGWMAPEPAASASERSSVPPPTRLALPVGASAPLPSGTRKNDDESKSVPPPTGMSNPNRSELSSSQKFNRAAPKVKQEFPEPIPGDSGPQGTPANSGDDDPKLQPRNLPSLRASASNVDPRGTIPPAPAESIADSQAVPSPVTSPSGAISAPVQQNAATVTRRDPEQTPSPIRDASADLAMNRPAPPSAAAVSRSSGSAAVPPPASLAGPMKGETFLGSLESSPDPVADAGQGRRRGSRNRSAEPALPAPLVDIQLPRPAVTAAPTKAVTFPMLVRNRSAAEEAFRLGVSLTGDYEAIFVLDDNQDGRVQPTELTISVTPVLPPGGVVSVVLVMRVPKDAAGRQDFQITATPMIAQTTPYAVPATLVTPSLPPTMAVDVEFDHESVRRGRDFDYIIRIVNQGDAAAHTVQLNYTVSTGYVMESASPVWRSYDPAIRTGVWNFDSLAAGSATTIKIRLKLDHSAQPGASVIGFGTLHAQSMAPITIGGAPVLIDERPAGPGAEVQAVFRNLSATPQSATFIPFVVRNTGDRPDQFDLRVEPFAGMVFADTNRDGVYQNGERSITRTPELAAGKDFFILVKVDVPEKAGGQQEFAYRLVATSVNDRRVSAGGVCFLKLAVPRLIIERTVSTAQLQADRVIYYTLTIRNAGDGEAKRISVIEALLPGNEFINSDVKPSISGGTATEPQRLKWSIESLAPGASVTYRLAVRRNSNAEQAERATATFFDNAGNQYVAQ